MTTANRGRDQARMRRPAVVADVVVVSDGHAPTLTALRALGLRISHIRDARAIRQLLDELRQPAVIVVYPSARVVVDEIARVQAERPELRAVLLSREPGSPCPAGVDEILPADAPEDEVMGRVVVQLAHARSAAPRRLPVADDTVLDLDAGALRRRGRLIHLRPLESRLLEELARSPGRPLSRDWLMERAWSSVPAPGSRTVDVHVRWLRQKLEPDPRRPVHLLTVRGLGYQLEPDAGWPLEADPGH
jgi:DNA-binding winged helix-turn-helix (wHTH) protein